MKGDSKKFDEFGKTLLIKGEKESNIRFTATGHHMVACSCFLAGDHPSAIESWEKAIRHLVDPIWLYHVKCLLAISYLHENQLEEAENVCQEIVRHSETFGTEVWGTAAQGLLGIISITKGNLGKGVRILKHNMELWLESGSKYRYIVGCYLLGKTYMEIAQGGGQKNFSFLIKNIGFLIKNFPFAQRKAQGYFNKAIDVSKQIGSNGILGQVYLDLGLFYKGEKKAKKARKCICDAIDLFKQCNAYVYQKKAEEVLTSLE
jgi:tetratricopeptide (TPR) repeat protein